MNVKKFFENRRAGFWLGLGAAAVMLIADVLFLILDVGDRTFSAVTFVAVLAGSIVMFSGVFLRLDFLPVVASVLYGVGLGKHLYLGLPTMSDVLNEVNFVGGNPVMVVVFGAIFFLGLACTVACCFMSQNKAALKTDSPDVSSAVSEK